MEPQASVDPSEPVAKPVGPEWVAALGRLVLGQVRTAREIADVLRQTLYYSMRRRCEPGQLVKQMYEVGNRSLFLLVAVMGFIGMIMVLQAGIQTRRIVPDLSMLGPSYIQLLVRDLAATIASLMLATRVGAGIAAELGSMVVTEQIDALRMCAADPIDYLVKPRFLASLLMTVLLTVVSGAIAIGTGMATARIVFEVPPQVFWNLRLVHGSDLFLGLLKAVAYGAAIPIVSAHAGLSTFGGSKGVGWATTRAVVSSSLAIVMLDFLLSTFGLLVFPSS